MPSHFSNLLESICHLDQPRLVSLQPAKAYAKRDTLLVLPSRHNDAGVATNGEMVGSIVLGCNDRVKLVLLHQLLQPIRGELLQQADPSSLNMTNAVCILG